MSAGSLTNHRADFARICLLTSIDSSTREVAARAANGYPNHKRCFHHGPLPNKA